MSTNQPQSDQTWQPPAPPVPERPKSWFARHKFLTALLAVVVLAIIGSTLTDGGSQPVTTTQPAASQPAAQPAASQPAAEPEAAPAGAAKVGTPVRDGKFEFTVTKVETGIKRVGPDIVAEKAQGQFVLVHLTVENIGTEPQTLIDSEQKVRDAAGRQFSSDSMAAMVIEGNDVLLNEINPGNTVTGTLVYDMPKGAQPASIELHDSMFSDGVTVALS